METNTYYGEYVAPEIDVIEIKSQQAILVGSDMTVNNPFSGSENDW